MNGGRQTHVGPLGEAEGAAAGEGASDGIVRAPMHGRLVALSVAEGEAVEAGQRLAVLEAMKMEHALTAPRAGRVTLGEAVVGETVEQGAVMMTVEE
jgi:3-methylcrotonyl-CoA carboxylase alpha subunit